MPHAYSPIGWSHVRPEAPLVGRSAVITALRTLDLPFWLLRIKSGQVAVHPGPLDLQSTPGANALPVIARVGELTPDQLGDPSFQRIYGVKLNYVAGAMANGIASAELVIAMARAGMIGFFGAAGLPTERIVAALDEIQSAVPNRPYGVNLIHSPSDPRQEQASVDLFLARKVRAVSASAYMALTPMVVQYRVSGLHRDAAGRIVAPNKLLAKVSRPEVAERFMRPAQTAMLQSLVQAGRITAEEASLAANLPVATDITAEADSGGHTDNRPLPVLLPLLQDLRARVARDFPAAAEVRIGAAGGLGDPTAVAAAFAMGAAYVVTGTVNQACVEAGTSEQVRIMLSKAGMADVGMAPASDMFEAGVELQVLKRGTMFPMRARQLYAVYRDYASLDAIPVDVRTKLEAKTFRRPLTDVWADTEAFFSERDPEQISRANTDPKHKMALVFRWYLGLSSRWAIAGQADRMTDAQIWCGPAIGTFNAWTAGTFLAQPANRKVAVVGANLMAGAAAITRARWLAQQGVNPGDEAFCWVPRPLRATPAQPNPSREPHVHA